MDTLLFVYSALLSMCKKTRRSKRIDNYFSLPSNSQQRDDADAVIVNGQTEDFERIDDVISDK